MGLLGRLFCVLIIVVGLGIAVANVKTVYDGGRIWLSGTQVEATIIDKHIDRPTNSGRPVRVESISVNGYKVRSPRTYFYDYFLTVRYTVDGNVIEALAPVGYHDWHEERVGNALTVLSLASVPAYVDAQPRDTLIYGLRRIGLGFLIMIVGAVALRLQDA
ncbi:hypothetical protein SLH49_15295 [Cognatiyoonia sp. IB215446]|uniref:hypothetical protein n=1 Tax=Cognatiyoonia sp. IB215446 TaxID=3097355 RepID=UPI002A0ABF3A|nr:hypothetical protein [Cognatiyoonia sp. IB215446]MDX8349351.1 hypothetical protein [Cognatiyoonia sp. IB215446]